MGQDPRSHMQITNPTIIPQMYRVEFLGAYCHLSSGRRVGIMNSTPSSLKSHGRISLSSSFPGSSTLHIQPQLTWSLSFPLPICQARAYLRAYLQMHRNSHPFFPQPVVPSKKNAQTFPRIQKLHQGKDWYLLSLLGLPWPNVTFARVTRAY